MQINGKYTFGFFLVISLIATACIKDINNFDQGLTFTPFYSLPIGNSTINMQDIAEAPNFDTIPADTLLPDDSVFVYEGNRYALLPDNRDFDTLLIENYNFSSLAEVVDNATYVRFRLNIENAIPAIVTLQVNFIDQNNDLIFSLFSSDGLSIPAATSENHTILSPYDTDELTTEEIQRLPDIRIVQFYLGVSIQNYATGAEYFADQFVDVQMGVKIGLIGDIGD